MKRRLDQSPDDAGNARNSWQMPADTAAAGAWTAVAKAAGALKFVVAAPLVGTGDEMDAYLIPFLLPSFAADVLAGPFELVLVPAMIQARDTRGRSAAGVLYSKTIQTGFLAQIAGVMAIGAGPVLERMGAGFNLGTLEYTRFLALAMLPVIPLSAIWVAARSALVAERHSATATTAGTAAQAAACVWVAGRAGFRIRAGVRGAPTASLRKLAHQ